MGASPGAKSLPCRSHKREPTGLFVIDFIPPSSIDPIELTTVRVVWGEIGGSRTAVTTNAIPKEKEKAMGQAYRSRIQSSAVTGHPVTPYPLPDELLGQITIKAHGWPRVKPLDLLPPWTL